MIQNLCDGEAVVEKNGEIPRTHKYNNISLHFVQFDFVETRKKNRKLAKKT